MDKDTYNIIRNIQANSRASYSRGNIHSVDPDNPFEIQRFERERLAFDTERHSLRANILYAHGFASAGNSATAQEIQKYLPNCRVISPDLPIAPDEAIELLTRIVIEEKIDVAVGTSMGGMLVQKLRGTPKVLVNPAFHVSDLMRREIGIVPFFNRRADGATEFEVTEALCDAYKNLETSQFNNLTDHEISITYGLFGTDDTTVNGEAEYDLHYRHKMIFIGGHRLTSNNVHDYVVEAILALTQSNNI